MLSLDKLRLLESYTGGTIRAKLSDPEDNSRTLGQIVTLIRKVLNKPNDGPTTDPRILKMREKDKVNTLKGKRDRSKPLPTGHEPFVISSPDTTY